MRIKLQALKRLVSDGRNCGSVCWNKCLPLIASFCTQKEHHSQMTYRQASNLASITKVSHLTKIYKEIRGKTISECISAAKFAFLLTVLHNNITNENQIYAWKPAEPRFTNTSMKGGVSGWPQEGLDFYIEKLRQEMQYREELNKKYEYASERPDYVKNGEDVNTDESATCLQEILTDADNEKFEILLSVDDDDESNSATSSQKDDCDNDDNDEGSCALLIDTKEKNSSAKPNIRKESTVSI